MSFFILLRIFVILLVFDCILIGNLISLPSRCHQLLVNYTKMPFHEFQKEPRDLNSITWDIGETRFLINSEGCGYPPRVNCTEFAKEFG